ncbi:uncharacterized protein cusr [Rhinichthys klamathensis goyatoka]|uniref:uncharacterized protein cusr n=1 Tax=Rhinichthys klamathensis goyatoka TaxID=3034132 RepID=UPI0024B5DE9C|nr:uncharacterized protein cusr [Rhinichthys klamathensis goyatoka]
MLLPRALTLFILWGCASCVRYRAEFNMEGITGWINFDSTELKSTVNLTGTGTCRSFNISLTTFPVMYGHFASPCQKSNIGDSVFTFSVGTPQAAMNVSALFEQHLSLEALSVLVETCNGTRICAGLMSESQVRTWQARFFSPVGGNIFIRQVTGETGARVLSDLRTLNQTRTFTNVTILVSQSSTTNCTTLLGSLDPKSLTKLGFLSVGSPLEPVKSRLEISALSSGVRFAVLDLTSSYACAEIRKVELKVVSAVLNMQGIKGYFTFHQPSPFDLTTITVNLTNLDRRVGPYHVHQFPLPQMRSPSDSSCSNNNVGGHWNPFNVNVQAPAYPPPRGSTHDRFEVGDLSARHSSLENASNFQATLTDWNLPLFGRNSIVGRSVVIHLPNTTRFACASIGYPGEVTVAKAAFRGPVVGTVLFTQLSGEPYSDVSVFMDLSYAQLSAPSTLNHNWHVHNYPISTETDSDKACCLSTGGHWNPFYVDTTVSAYTVNCGPDSPFACEVGDIAGKQKTLDLQSEMGTVATKNFFTDTTSWLSGMIGRSLVVHGPNQTAPRIACANLTLFRFSSARSSSWYGPESSEGQIRFSQVSPQGPTILNISFTGLNTRAGGYHVHILPIKSVKEPCSDSNIMGHFNPFSVNATSSPASGIGTVDQYEIGDISGKFGYLTGQNTFQNQYMDGNMPLSGPNSIIGRSLVIHYNNGSRMMCADISAEDAPDGNRVTAEAMFSGAVTGTVMMYQQTFPDGSYGDVMLEVDVQASQPLKFAEASWYIADEPVGSDGSCPGEDEMFNPFNITNMNNCSQMRALSCLAGDLTGRHGPISLTKRQLYNDILLQLAGDFTVVQRSLVLRLNSTTTTCADIRAESPSAMQIFPNKASFSRYDFRKRVADVLNLPISRVSILPGSPSQRSDGKCQEVNYLVSGKVSQEKLSSVKTSDKMGVFKESKKCTPSGKAGLMLVPCRMLLSVITAGVFLLGLLRH